MNDLPNLKKDFQNPSGLSSLSGGNGFGATLDSLNNTFGSTKELGGRGRLGDLGTLGSTNGKKVGTLQVIGLLC